MCVFTLSDDDDSHAPTSRRRRRNTGPSIQPAEPFCLFCVIDERRQLPHRSTRDTPGGYRSLQLVLFATIPQSEVHHLPTEWGCVVPLERQGRIHTHAVPSSQYECVFLPAFPDRFNSRHASSTREQQNNTICSPPHERPNGGVPPRLRRARREVPDGGELRPEG